MQNGYHCAAVIILDLQFVETRAEIAEIDLVGADLEVLDDVRAFLTLLEAEYVGPVIADELVGTLATKNRIVPEAAEECDPFRRRQKADRHRRVLKACRFRRRL